jgi:hypothetical protein
MSNRRCGLSLSEMTHSLSDTRSDDNANYFFNALRSRNASRYEHIGKNASRPSGRGVSHPAPTLDHGRGTNLSAMRGLAAWTTKTTTAATSGSR